VFHHHFQLRQFRDERLDKGGETAGNAGCDVTSCFTARGADERDCCLSVGPTAVDPTMSEVKGVRLHRLDAELNKGGDASMSP